MWLVNATDFLVAWLAASLVCEHIFPSQTDETRYRWLGVVCGLTIYILSFSRWRWTGLSDMLGRHWSAAMVIALHAMAGSTQLRPFICGVGFVVVFVMILNASFAEDTVCALRRFSVSVAMMASAGALRWMWCGAPLTMIGFVNLPLTIVAVIAVACTPSHTSFIVGPQIVYKPYDFVQSSTVRLRSRATVRPLDSGIIHSGKKFAIKLWPWRREGLLAVVVCFCSIAGVMIAALADPSVVPVLTSMPHVPWGAAAIAAFVMGGAYGVEIMSNVGSELYAAEHHPPASPTSALIPSKSPSRVSGWLKRFTFQQAALPIAGRYSRLCARVMAVMGVSVLGLLYTPSPLSFIFALLWCASVPIAAMTMFVAIHYVVYVQRTILGSPKTDDHNDAPIPERAVTPDIIRVDYRGITLCVLLLSFVSNCIASRHEGFDRWYWLVYLPPVDPASFIAAVSALVYILWLRVHYGGGSRALTRTLWWEHGVGRETVTTIARYTDHVAYAALVIIAIITFVVVYVYSNRWEAFMCGEFVGKENEYILNELPSSLSWLRVLFEVTR